MLARSPTMTRGRWAAFALLLLAGGATAAASGDLEVRAPKGAEVFLDGESKGKLNSKDGRTWKRIPPGSMRIRVEVKGYVALEGDIAVVAGETTLVQVSVMARAPSDQHPAPAGVPAVLAARFTSRSELVEAAGGTDEQLAAIDRGLEWLARHQSPDGSWSGARFDDQCKKCAGAAEFPWIDPGLTGLALLAFLGAGHTCASGAHADTVKRGVDYLLAQQDEEGCLGARDGQFMYNHAIATQALCEALACGDEPKLRAGATRALEFLRAAQNPGLAWRYTVMPGDNDTSVTAWCLQALHAGRLCGVSIPDATRADALAWLAKATDPASGTIGYRTKGDGGTRLQAVMNDYDRVEAITAAGLVGKALLRIRKGEQEVIALGVERVARELPAAGEAGLKRDHYYWYYGGLALSLLDRRALKAWNVALLATLLPEQEQAEGLAGSWPTTDPWGAAAGRVYTTAISVLALEAPFRLLPGLE